MGVSLDDVYAAAKGGRIPVPETGDARRVDRLERLGRSLDRARSDVDELLGGAATPRKPSKK